VWAAAANIIICFIAELLEKAKKAKEKGIGKSSEDAEGKQLAQSKCLVNL